MFGFEKLHVFTCANDFLILSASLAEKLPRGFGDLSEQLRRAALSIPLNIAEGSGKYGRDQRRFYAIARGSALECAAILVSARSLDAGNGEKIEEGLALLNRIVAMLTVMCREKKG